ncbi:hypothetical protein QUF76_16335 [Desulfobacterales bacterium HSG16]|nr:hypothetical protein [Desulfobacterales bacterium HSG16]
MKQKYYPKVPPFILVSLVGSFTLSATMYHWWKASESLIVLLLAIVFLGFFMLCLNPIIIWRTVVIEKDSLTVFRRFYKPLIVNITDSIYQIYLKNNKVRLFLFKIGEGYLHVAPENYTKSNELTEQIMAYTKKQHRSVGVIYD